MYLQKDPSIQKEATLQEISQQCSAAWKTKMEELHGASWRKTLAASASRRTAVAASSAQPPRRADGGLGAGFPTSSPKVPRRADGGLGAGFPTGSPKVRESSAIVPKREEAGALVPVGASSSRFSVLLSPRGPASDSGHDRPRTRDYRPSDVRSEAGSEYVVRDQGFLEIEDANREPYVLEEG